MKVNAYILVFGVIAAIIAAAALSTLVFNMNLGGAAISGINSTSYKTLSNLQNYGPAPNIQGISAWINSPPLNITDLRGKVVLVDFWTYSCINCIRTIPFLNALQRVYGNDGLVIIGVHTPEFQFEHNLSNVESAVKQFNITYAVALDNNYSTWDAYGNNDWPADYLIAANGDIRYESIGEGPENFNQTQQVVRELLENANYTLPPAFTNVTDALNFSQPISPEMYFGYQELENGRTDYFGNTQGLQPDMTYNYTFTNISQADAIYLSGSWDSTPFSLVAENDSKIFIVYRAKSVNVVAGAANVTSSIITVKLDGKELNSSYLGNAARLVNGTAVVNVSAYRLYNIVSGPDYGVHLLEIDANKGFSIYTFTFG